MDNAKNSFRFTPRHQGYFALALWGVAIFLLLRHDLYGLDEGAARSLLISWSIADQLATSVFMHGMPDFRVLLFLPVGYLWTDNVVAAKVLTVLLIALSAWLLYGWRNRTSGAESAMLATGLLLISPLALSQIDSISVGGYLLAAIAVGSWLDMRYRANPRPFNGWFFALIFSCAFATSLHPAGLAVPLALGLSWRTLPQAVKFQRFFLGGVIFIAIFAMVVRSAWLDLDFLQNPVKSLSAPFAAGYVDDGVSAWQWLPGAIIIALSLLVALTQYRALWSTLTGRMLLIAFVLGGIVSDQAWGLIALSLTLYGGFPALLGVKGAQHEGTFLHQRGLALAVVVVTSTVFMLADKAHYTASRNGVLSHQDQLIQTLAIAAQEEHEAAQKDEGVKHHARFTVASQWPSRTLIACKCDTFPLPPAAATPEKQLEDLRARTITNLILNPRLTSNLDLVRNFSSLGAQVETVSLQPGGVMLHVKEQAPAPSSEKKAKS